jgi:hypothetical protein
MLSEERYAGEASLARTAFEHATGELVSMHEKIWNHLASCTRHARLANRARVSARGLRTAAAQAAAATAFRYGFVGRRGSPALALQMMAEADRLERVAKRHAERADERYAEVAQLQQTARQFELQQQPTAADAAVEASAEAHHHRRRPLPSQGQVYE